MFLFATNAWAAGAETAAAQPNIFASLAPILLICVVFYFLLIRPQQKQMRQHQEMLTKLKKGDKVITASGILAIVQKVADDGFMTIEIAPEICIKIKKENITEVVVDKSISLPSIASKAKNKSASKNKES